MSSGTYILRFVGSDGQISRVRAIACDNNADAINAARSSISVAFSIEVWRSEERVATLIRSDYQDV